MSAATWALLIAVFVACVVEMVEATTIVMAMGFVRGWRSTMVGVAAALVVLAVVTTVAGYSIATWLPVALLQLVIGGLLLVFGLQWLRKAILRASGRKAVHDEDAIYAEEVAAARQAPVGTGWWDRFGFAVSFKGVFLEGMEVVFIVITFGLNAGDVPIAVVGAAAAVLVVLALAVAARRPLSMINENALKFGVGLLLTTFGTFWVVEGAGVLRGGHASLQWPGHEVAIVVVLAVWVAVSFASVRVLRTKSVSPATTGAGEQPVGR
jgi:uncharacterized membrane protein